MSSRLEDYLNEMPVVAIIRGVKPEEVVEIGEAIIKAGVKVIEVPLNSPSPFESIQLLTEAVGDRAITGAGTVLTVEDVDKVKAAGGTIIVTPNTNAAVIERSVELGMVPLPGFATGTEAFTAYHAGARYLKLFPASTYGVAHIKALKAVLPKDASVFAVGGAGAANANEWFEGGADGFGVGSEIYKAGDSAEVVYEKALKLVGAIKAVQN